MNLKSVWQMEQKINLQLNLKVPFKKVAMEACFTSKTGKKIGKWNSLLNKIIKAIGPV